MHDYFVLVFLHVGSRRVFVTPPTLHPNAEWVVEQAQSFCHHLQAEGLTAELLFHDSDTKFTRAFDDTLRARGVSVRRVQPLSPNQNAFAERWVQSIKQECLDRFIVFGEEHLRHIVKEYLEFYNTERPHQARDALSTTEPPDKTNLPAPSGILCRERLGGLLKHYRRAA